MVSLPTNTVKIMHCASYSQQFVFQQSAFNTHERWHSPSFLSHPVPYGTHFAGTDIRAFQSIQASHAGASPNKTRWKRNLESGRRHDYEKIRNSGGPIRHVGREMWNTFELRKA